MLQLLIYPVDEVLVPAEALSVTGAGFMSYLVKSLELAPNGVDHTPASLIFSAVQLNAGNKVGAAGMQSWDSGWPQLHACTLAAHSLGAECC